MNIRWSSAALIMALSHNAIAGDGYKGSVKPNWGLADFTKHDEAYYLSLDQIRIGWTQAQVIEAFGKKYKVVEISEVDGKKHESWRFNSYRARMLSDPVDSSVTVEFIDGVVVNAKQVPAPGSDVQPSELVKMGTAPPQNSISDRLKELQQLLDDKLISTEEYEAKRKALIDGL